MNVRTDVYVELPELVAAVLTPREQDVAKLLLCGLGNTEIAKALGLKEQTVKKYLKFLWLKTGMPGRCCRIVLAMKLSGAY